MGTVCDAKRVRYQIERMDKYVAELERKVYEYGDVAAELDAMREKMSTGLTMLAAMKVKQTSMFHDLVAAHDRVARDCGEQSKRLADVRADNERRRCQLNRLCGQHDRQKEVARQLKARWVALQAEADVLRKRRADAAAAAERSAEAQRSAETELEARERQLAAVQAALADRTAEQDRLAAEVRAERECAERLRSDIDALTAANDDTVQALRADAAELRCREDETATAVSALARELDECLAETAGHEKRAAQVRRDVRRLHDECCERKARADREAAELEAEVNGAQAELVAVNKRLCVERAMTTELKRQIACREDSIRRSEATRERLRLEACRFREDAELTADLVREERERCDDETRTAKLKLASRDECEFGRPVDERTEELVGGPKTAELSCPASAEADGDCHGTETDATASSGQELFSMFYDEPPPEQCDGSSPCPGQESLCLVYVSCNVGIMSRMSVRVDKNDDDATSPQRNRCEECTVE